MIDRFRGRRQLRYGLQPPPPSHPTGSADLSQELQPHSFSHVLHRSQQVIQIIPNETYLFCRKFYLCL
jgi:hypothetical protein